MARLAVVCCAASLCFFANAIKVTPYPVQGINVAFLVQADGHAAAKPGGNAGRSPSCKGAGCQLGISQPGKLRQR
ncbi:MULTISPECIES: hypothetical protein [Escherichia]|uniref:hypothetical protein n=1 Tax=Escherichia TaxID=561 RepID=UPI000409CF2E|nr:MULTISPECIES: hypothetical protein [Escherichia]EFO1359190.1 hypothetical protein [Escherichia coli]MDZ5481168.1 hypothetical protein [Escherichia marmotae]MEC9706892.1 hypothetical protein [Escherichia marmotae]MEC9710496.1 hypothetical protein [Escherichia marmotae]MED0206726.1 hypothetical protein [Escherichia marmotae]